MSLQMKLNNYLYLNSKDLEDSEIFISRQSYRLTASKKLVNFTMDRLLSAYVKVRKFRCKVDKKVHGFDYQIQTRLGDDRQFLACYDSIVKELKVSITRNLEHHINDENLTRFTENDFEFICSFFEQCQDSYQLVKLGRIPISRIRQILEWARI